MRTQLLTVFFLISSLSILGQSSYGTQTSDTTLYGLASQSDFYGDVDVYNYTSSTLGMTWVADSTNLPVGWEYSICDPFVCNPIGVAQDDWNLSSNDGYLNIHFYPNGVNGTGTVRLKLHPTSNPSEVTWITFTGTTETSYILEQSEHQIKLKNSFVTNGIPLILEQESINDLDNITYEMYDLLGNLVLVNRLSTNSNQIFLNVGDFSTGMHLITFKSNGKVLGTSKFVVSK